MKNLFDLWWNTLLYDPTLSAPKQAVMFLITGVLQGTLLAFAIAFVDLGIVQPIVDTVPPDILPHQITDYIAPHRDIK
jgi:hypothetical protein